MGMMDKLLSKLNGIDKAKEKEKFHALLVQGVQAIQKNPGLEQKESIDCHFFYMQGVQFYHRHREEKGGMGNAVWFCLQQIRIAPLVIEAMGKEGWLKNGRSLPAHTGYKQLCIIYQKEGKYREVIQLAEQALQQGWNGDWEKRAEKAGAKLK